MTIPESAIAILEAKVFPIPFHMLTREQKRYLANRGYDTGVPVSHKQLLRRADLLLRRPLERTA